MNPLRTLVRTALFPILVAVAPISGCALDDADDDISSPEAPDGLLDQVQGDESPAIAEGIVRPVSLVDTHWTLDAPDGPDAPDLGPDVKDPPISVPDATTVLLQKDGYQLSMDMWLDGAELDVRFLFEEGATSKEVSFEKAFEIGSGAIEAAPGLHIALTKLDDRLTPDIQKILERAVEAIRLAFPM